MKQTLKNSTNLSDRHKNRLAFEPVLAGVKVRLTQDPEEAWEIINALDECQNCENYTPLSLFHGRCNFPEGGELFEVSCDNCCECFYARDKRINYWMSKLVEMTMEYDGTNDFMRQLNYHQEMGTDLEFLGINDR